MRGTLIGLLLAVGIIVGGSFVPARVVDPLTVHHELTVATNVGWVPQSYLDEHHQLIGMDIDVAREIGRRLGVSVRFETPDFSAMTGGHWHGRWDMAVGSVTPTKARSHVVDFAGIYYYSPYVFAVHSASRARTIADLNGKRIGVETGTTSEDYMRRRLQIDAPDAPPVDYLVTAGDLHTYADSMLPFDDLRLGDGVRIDAVIAPEQTVLRAIQNGYPIRILPGYAFREPLAVLTDKGNPQWTARVGAAITAMRDDGTLSAFTTKWYGKDYSR